MNDTSPSSHYINMSMRYYTTSASAAMSIDKLLPALLECFGIILCGYIAGRANIITSTQAKGLGNFVSKFALPALLFKNMVLLDFGDVIWPFLWSILIAKVCVFFVVCVLTLLVTSRDTRFSKAGLFSIFATQSNDFALGYPIGKCCDIVIGIRKIWCNIEYTLQLQTPNVFLCFFSVFHCQYSAGLRKYS